MEEKLNNSLTQAPVVDVRNEEWYGTANAIFNARMVDHRSPGQPGGYESYLMEARKYQSNLDPLQTMGYLHAQEAIDSNWEYARELGKSFYNGGVGVVRDTLNGIRAARDYNIALLNEQAAAQGVERNLDQRFIEALDDAVKAQALQPFDVKQSASAAGQFGLDLAQGAGQLVGQMTVSIPAETVAPGIGGLAMMVGQITGGQYEDLKAKGVDTKRAAEAAFANAVIQAPFERLALTRLMRKIPGNTVLKKKLKMVFENMATEGVTEFIQQFPEEWAELWALNPDKSWKELQAMAAKKFPDTLQNALYAGLIGAVLGAGSSGIHIAIDRNVDLALRKEVHDESIMAMAGRIDKIKQSGISPDYAAETINANLNNATVLIDGDTLHAYAQKAGAEKVAEKLGVSAETISEAARKGDTVEVNQGNFESMAASSPDFFETVRDSVSFDSKDISNRKYDTIQTNIERYSNLEEEQRKDLKAEVDKIAATMEEAGAAKGVVEAWKAIATNFALQARPDNPAQFLRDNPLRFEKGTTPLAQPSLNFSSNTEDINLVKEILDTNYETPRAEAESRLKAVEEEISKIGEERPAENAQEWINLNRQRDLLKSLLNGNSVVGVPSIDDYKKYYDREGGSFNFPQQQQPDQYFQVSAEEFNRQKEEVRKQYQGTDQWMKAPNGKPTNLTEDQWVTVRTPAFKAWFGDWEYIAKAYPEREAKERKDVNDYLKSLKGKQLKSEDEDIVATFSHKGLGKVASDAAINKSKRNGFTIQEHLTAVANIEKLFANSIKSNERDDHNNSNSLKGVEHFSSLFIAENNKPALVTFTVKVTDNAGRKIYSIELMELKKVEGKVQGEALKLHQATSTFDKLNISQIADKINNCSKIVDVNGEPKVMYHGTPTGGFDTFKVPAFLTDRKEYAERYARQANASDTPQIYEVFANVKDPFDTRNEEEATVYERFRQEEGGAGLMNNGLPDWTDAESMYDWMDENDIKNYDATMQNEPDSSVSYMVFKSNQIKDATGRNVGFDMGKGNIYLQTANSQPLNEPVTPMDKLKADAAAWGKTVDNFTGKIITDDYIRVMDTPLALSLAGAKLLPIEIKDKNLNKILYGKHANQFNSYILKQIPEALANPLAIFFSDSQPGTKDIVVAVELKDKNGSGIIVPIRLSETITSKGYEANILTSAYGKDKGGSNPTPRYEWFYQQIRNGNLKYINKKKLATLLNGEERLMALSTQAMNELHSALRIADENDLVKLKEENPGYYQRQQLDRGNEVKGSFDPFTQGEGVIRLFEGADASTVIHETGHYYIETMWREIEAGRASEQQKADFEKLMQYCGITTEQWAKTDRKGREVAHERLAEAIETYIMEDKAPTRELRPVFKRFAKWLKSVYAAISRNKNAVPLTDEVREVFDRMLSAQEDVEEMRRVEGYFEKLPSVITDNLSDATKRRIEDYILKAQDKAVEILTKERLANFSETRKRAIENYRNMIGDEVRHEVANRPLYVASRTVREVIGGEQAASAKVYAKQYTEDKMDKETGIAFEIIAEQNGFTPNELAGKILEDPTETEAYKAAMAEAVRKEFPDYYTEREQAEEAAREAMYNDESGILLGVEQILIEDFANKAKAQQRSAETARKLAIAKRQQAKVAAQKELAGMKVKDATRVDRFIAAERRCAEKSAEAMAKKDYETARQYKDMQAFNHACVIESANLRKRMEQYKKFLKRQFRSKRETWTNEMHFNQAAALFARIGLLRKDYDPTTRTQSLLDYLNEMGEMLYAFNEVPDWLADDTYPITDPKNMSFDDYEKVIDLMRYIKTMAKIEKAANFFDSSSTYQEWKANALENLNKLATKFAPVLGERQVASWMEKFQAAYQTLDNFLEKMDGWHYGFFSECFGDAIKHANDNEFVHLEAYQKRKAEIENAWCPTQEAIEAAGKDVYYEELGASANKFVLTKMLMNLGNEGNARKLCSSYPSEALRGSSLWVFPDGLLSKDEAIAQTKENLLEFLGRVLTKEDIAYAQAKVDLAGMYWGEIADLERRTRGFTPKKVEAYPVTLKLANGEEVVFRGGYFPLIRNGEMGSHPVGILPVSETDTKQGKNVRTMYTDSGHTISRVEAEYPVDLTDGSEDWAMRKAIHDLCWRETMTDFRRILNDQVMFGLMKQKLGIADMTAFREMLEQAAQPNGGSSMAMGEGLLAQTAGWLRRKTVNSIVMLNLRINLQNFGNFFLYGNTVEGFGYSDVIAAMGNAFSRGFDGKGFFEMWAFVDEKSAFMRSRSENPDITLADLREEGKLNKFERSAMEWGAKAMMYTDGLTARPVWMQAYTKKINEGKTEQQAIDFADTIIRRTLGSGRVTDVASLQRGGPVYKLFTAFQGFFNTQFNQWVREYNIDRRLLAEGNTAEAVQRITAFVASKYLAACLFNLVFALEKPFDKDDDEYMNYTKELLHYPMSLVGIYGPIANFAMDKTLGMKAYSYRMSIIESSLDKVFRASGKLGKMVEGDFEAGLEGLTDVAGIYAGVPAQMNRLFWNAWDIFVNGMDSELRDLATRRPKRERK